MDNINNIIKYTKKLKLLYVEDNITTMESTLIILEDFFDEIIVASDGQEGLEKFRDAYSDKKEKSFDIVMTDIYMPRLDGMGMIKHIKDIDMNILVLIITAYNEIEYFINSIKFGVEGYLLKPIDLDQYIEVLSKITKKIMLENEIKRHANLLSQYKEITDKSSIITIISIDKTISYVNDSFCKISQYESKEIIGQACYDILQYKQTKELYDDMWNTISINKSIWQGVIKFKSKSGALYYLKTTIKPILNENGIILEYISLQDDITTIMNPKRQLDDAIKNSKFPMIVLMKVEEFDILDEFYDSETIEKIQDKIINVLKKNIPEVCNFEKVYRLGNGEYALITDKINNDNINQDFIKHLHIYHDSINESSIQINTSNVDYLNNINYNISMIMSVAFGDKPLESAKLGIKKLLINKQKFIVSNSFAKIEKTQALKNLHIILMVKEAIDQSKIVSYFQPIINNKTKKIVKYESLVRLIKNDGSTMTPVFFLDVAKKGKYYSLITKIVLNNAFDALLKTNKDISINLSTIDIENKFTRYHIYELLEKNKQNSHRITFELLEDESVKEFDILLEFIQNVKSKGVKIAIDDFGAGYSNFKRLLDYQPDILKIDGSLIKNICDDQYSLSIVKTIVSFAKEQNILVIAEYVHSEEIFDILYDLDIEYSQGHYFSEAKCLSMFN